VSHNMAAVNALCHRAFVLDDGRVALAGVTAEAVHAYMTSLETSELHHTVSFDQPSCLPAWATRLTLYANDRASSRVRMGDRLSLGLEFRASTPVSEPSVGFVITAAQGNAVVNANNIYQTSPTLQPPALDGHIMCDLGVLPLMADTYTVTVWFGPHSGTEHQCFENCLAFEVVEHDTWGKGKLPTPRISSLWWPTRFEMVAENRESALGERL
jgi:hypothetical protein